ncbi:hypothetical protein DWZ54_06940 [Mitsuokella sp. AF33-22]|uniref:hypothetical protein n=1 Tax=Mitsuokella sp. AF33-22 TaxID=2292047 RepID=UPI000E4ACF4A|nr:hypothetical protein [Mitsuokella sp. AF33-22]RHM55043.1 hypothetical protein DWZ54_06940 [Mitsuokella sp. AF33-22]
MTIEKNHCTDEARLKKCLKEQGLDDTYQVLSDGDIFIVRQEAGSFECMGHDCLELLGSATATCSQNGKIYRITSDEKKLIDVLLACTSDLVENADRQRYLTEINKFYTND